MVKRNRTTFSTRQIQVRRWRGMGEVVIEGRDARKVKRNRTTFSTRQIQVRRWRGMSEGDDGDGD